MKKFPRWPPTSGPQPNGAWKNRSSCDAYCLFQGFEIISAAVDSGDQPCFLPQDGKHKVKYRNVGGVSLTVNFSATACAGLIFQETGRRDWNETVTVNPRADLQKAPRMDLARTIHSWDHAGGPGEIQFDFAIHNPGLYAQPSSVCLRFTV